MIYDILKRMISTNNYQKQDLEEKIKVFYAVGDITAEQYLELKALVFPVDEGEESSGLFDDENSSELFEDGDNSGLF